jgi:hypothetical protein
MYLVQIFNQIHLLSFTNFPLYFGTREYHYRFITGMVRVEFVLILVKLILLYIIKMVIFSVNLDIVTGVALVKSFQSEYLVWVGYLGSVVAYLYYNNIIFFFFFFFFILQDLPFIW